MLPALISTGDGDGQQDRQRERASEVHHGRQQDRPPDRHERVERQQPAPAHDVLEGRRVVVAVLLGQLRVQVEVTGVGGPVVADVHWLAQ